MKFKTAISVIGVATFLGGAYPAYAATSVEVLHWWTSGSEAKSIGILKQMMEKQGYQWKDIAVAGGNGDNAITALKSRVVAGNPPTAAQIKGPTLQDLAAEGMLANIDAAAKDWDQLLPNEISGIVKYKGHYVAVPFNDHRDNWLWINAEALKKIHAQPPATWKEFFDVADKLKAAGYIPIAHGGQPWQEATIFEDVVLSKGADFYRKALVQLDPAALNSPAMVDVFVTLRKISSYFDKASPGRDWNLATAMVINGKAGMQFMGDWAKGEFTNAGKQSGKDYLCVPAPGTAKGFIFNVDSFAMFKQNNPVAEKAQLALAATVMSPEFQEAFNLNKGSIPVRKGISRDKFDACAQRSMDDLAVAEKNNGFVPSLASNMAQPSSTTGAMIDVITQFMNSTQDPKKAAELLAKAAKVN
ncbi:MAG: ABC transporter substrate-binding protein [Collimonas sp.]|uniref:ABC transporter substrate-binding protein n=1 Tax=Collimonas sp. TaxID=1963772 RepID=UPI0032659988